MKKGQNPVVALLGTLDTKGVEYGFVRERLAGLGVHTLLIDAGIIDEPQVEPDISREEVARAAGRELEELVQAGDRGAAIKVMAEGAASLIGKLHREGRLDGILGLGGSGGTALVTQSMRGLPVGVPKLMVSTMASGDTRPYVGEVDVTMMYSVVDISGINQVSARILANAADAIAGMVTGQALPRSGEKPLIGASMFGVTTPAVEAGRKRLEELGYEVLVFHATGTGGQSMEALIRDGYLTGVFDLTTTELADDLVGGVLSAGPHRLEAAGGKGIPQVVSLGALDMVNFGPKDTVPSSFQERRLVEHNPTVTLMRTTPEECAELGRRLARKLNQAQGPVALFIPLKGVSALSKEGEFFHDPAADEALFHALREEIDRDVVEVHELDTDVNDPAFADAMAQRLHQLYSEWTGDQQEEGVQ
ncbi:Tm-1-like ATP-binding domain-containing protein [Kroppenstedtia eburnea]|uniref:Tm-1-like ATP-binding domain-containing protein n=1 Tax=Kroppenstedtia eburnea TaxID=714067 RepID=UPI00020C845C|nr:ABC superfamily ATP binding cassette transporter permease [Desmospora sp. 8437]